VGFDPAAFWAAFHDIEDPQRRAEATYLYEDAAHVADLDGPVGVVTHCAEFLAGPVIDHLGIADWFDVVLCCDDDTGWKPDPRPSNSRSATSASNPPPTTGCTSATRRATWAPR